MKKSKVIVLTSALLAVLLLGITAGVINQARAAVNCCDYDCGGYSCDYDCEPMTVEFVCDTESCSYEPITLELDSCMTGLEVKEALASALNDGGVMPTDLFLLYDDEDCQGQIYDEDIVGDYIFSGDTIHYVVSPVATGENCGDTGYSFEVSGYDQYEGTFYCTLMP